jgi:hypothetical protein
MLEKIGTGGSLILNFFNKKNPQTKGLFGF